MDIDNYQKIEMRKKAEEMLKIKMIIQKINHGILMMLSMSCVFIKLN